MADVTVSADIDTFLQAANNAAARSALGLGSIATQAASAVAITGGTVAGLTGLAIRDTSAAFDVTLAAVSSTPLSAGRTLTLDLVNAARTIKLAGNLDLAGNLTTSGANALTLTTTGATNVTLPTSGTLAILAANTFTATQTITLAAANTGVLASTGYSLTGSNATSMIDLAGTWNTSGNPTGIKLNITKTAVGTSAKLLDLQFGGSSRAYVDYFGDIVSASAGAGSGAEVALAAGSTGGSILSFRYNGGQRSYIQGGTGNGFGLHLVTGGSDGLAITGGTITDGSPILNITNTWNAGGTVQTGIKYNVTNTASAAGSLLMDLQVGAASKFSVDKDGLITSASATLIKTSTALTDGAAAQTATMTNGPAAGNPTKWIPINDNGTTRYIPAW